MSKLDAYGKQSATQMPTQPSWTKNFSGDKNQITQTRKVRRAEHGITHSRDLPSPGNIGERDSLGRKGATETKKQVM